MLLLLLFLTQFWLELSHGLTKTVTEISVQSAVQEKEVVRSGT